MHEISFAEAVLQLIEDATRQEEFSRVTTVFLEIGVFAGVEVEAMRFCFDAVARGSVAEGARLEIVATPGSGWCMQCSATVALREAFGSCPQCGAYQVQLTGGTEMSLKEIEVV